MVIANLNDLEILKVAMSMEEDGLNYYTNGAKHTDGELKKFLLLAAGQEKLHREKLQRLYNELSNTKVDSDEYLFDPDVLAYLKQLIENRVFSTKANIQDAFLNLKSAAEYAVKAEELSVELYSKMHDGITFPEAKKVMLELIDEEKTHVEFFAKILEDLEK
jgi:rubrerythrin